jgi:regulator of replication initiation timing
MQQSNSLPYLNLSRQVATLDHTVQMLVQYQRLLYIELLQIKRKLGMEETIPEEHHSQMMNAAPNMRQMGGELDISSIQRALNTQTSSSGRSRRQGGNVMESTPMNSSNITN